MSRAILVVDDNRELADNLAEILESEGYTPLVVEGPREALELARRRTFDVAVLDVRMPIMDGVALFKELSRLQPESTYLLMTAFTADERIADALAAGVTAVLQKPVPVHELLERLPHPGTQRYEVLVIDHDPDLAEALAESLRAHGYESRIAHEIARARAMVDDCRPDAVVVDVHLPDGNGADFARQLHGQRPQMPIILLTGYEPTGALAFIRHTVPGRCQILTKPFAPDLLLRMIRRAASEPPTP